MSERYHYDELQIARDPCHPAHVLPPNIPAGSRVLDVGCGAGQTLLAALPNQLSFGIDIDVEALKLGRSWTRDVQFVCARAEALPFGDAEFDVALARVSLAYTDLRRSLREVRRVLKPDGWAWLVLHPVSIPWRTAKAGGLKAWVYFGYIACNSFLFHFIGRMCPLFGRFESFQTSSGIKRALLGCGFRNIKVERGAHFVVIAQ